MANINFGPAGNSESFYAAGHKSTLEAPAWLRAIGLGAYEYQAGKGIYAADATFVSLGEKAAENGIRLSFHAPYYISLSSTEEEKRLKSVNYITDSARAADLMNAYIIVIHSGSTAKLAREDAMKLAEDTLEKTACALNDGGYRCFAGLETMGKENQLGTLEEVIRLCKIDTKLFRPVVDFGHLNARTLGAIKTPDDFKRIFDTIASELSPERAEDLHCHFSKIEYTDKGERKHLTFADEHYGPSYEAFISAVVSLGVKPNVICESDGTMAEDALTMKELYEKENAGKQ